MRVERGNFFWGPTLQGLEICLAMISIRTIIMRIFWYLDDADIYVEWITLARRASSKPFKSDVGKNDRGFTRWPVNPYLFFFLR